MAPHALPMRPHGPRGGSVGYRPRWAWSAVRRSHPLRRLSARSKRPSGTRGHHAPTAVARAALPLRTRLDSASAIAPAIGRRSRPMNSELWQQEPDCWLLAHLLAAPSRSTRHRQHEWSRVARHACEKEPLSLRRHQGDSIRMYAARACANSRVPSREHCRVRPVSW